MTALRSSLAPFAASMRGPDPVNARCAARDVYEASGGEIVLINKGWLPTWLERTEDGSIQEVSA